MAYSFDRKTDDVDDVMAEDVNELQAACEALSAVLTTKGDLWSFGSYNARLPVGSNNQILTADSAQTLGVKWANLGVPVTSWTPSWTNLTVGNGALVASYIQIGKLVFATIKLTFGSTTSISGSVSVDLPVNASGSNVLPLAPSLVLFDNNVATFYFGTGTYTGADSVTLRVMQADATYLKGANFSSSVPFTWAENDILTISMIYEAA